MSKHTPAPWKISSDSRKLNQELTLGGIAVKAYAQRYDDFVAMFNIPINETFGGREAAVANARLIGMAPELYEYVASSASAGCATAQALIAELSA